MKLAEYLAHFLVAKGVGRVFVVSGGANLHLIHGIRKVAGIDYVPMLHEQSCAFAADGWARITGKPGVAMTTSGPGATNLITGICSAYYDSVPLFLVTGQVATFREKGDSGVRQIGFQETDIISMTRCITNYAVKIEKKEQIRYELEKAWHLATSGRQGPVLVDIPDNLQREEIDPDNLRSFQPPPDMEPEKKFASLIRDVEETLLMLRSAKRPVVVWGAGVRRAGAFERAQDFIRCFKIPFAPTWAMVDLSVCQPECFVGTFGTHGTRSGNFAVQNADFILSIGSRLDTKATGSPVSTFARGATKVVVDVDENELGKFRLFGLSVDKLICADALTFLNALLEKSTSPQGQDLTVWKNKIAGWKSTYPVCLPEYHLEKSLNPYVFVKGLANATLNDEIIFLDTGCSLAWMMQGYSYKPGQRIFHDWNNTAMGWCLPASIAAALARPGRRVISISGDGSLAMNIQELATVIRHQLPLKIFVVDNDGQSMIRQTQDQWLDSCYDASSYEGGLPRVNFSRVAEAFGFSTREIRQNSDLETGLKDALNTNGPHFCTVFISADHRVRPQVKFGRPNEDLEPLLPRAEFKSNMLIPPLPEPG